MGVRMCKSLSNARMQSTWLLQMMLMVPPEVKKSRLAIWNVS